MRVDAVLSLFLNVFFTVIFLANNGFESWIAVYERGMSFIGEFLILVFSALVFSSFFGLLIIVAVNCLVVIFRHIIRKKRKVSSLLLDIMLAPVAFIFVHVVITIVFSFVVGTLIVLL